MNYIVAHRDFLGQQLSPKYGNLALRAACPVSGSAKRAQNKAKPRTRARPKPKAKSTTSASPSERIGTDVLLAIKPDHLANIISREKNHEYRKYRLKDGVVRLHIASIPSSIRHEPGSVPTEPPGIGNAEFNAGLKQSKFGYPILELYELVNPVTLSEIKTRWAAKPTLKSDGNNNPRRYTCEGHGSMGP
ncbi:hypothetical protein CEP54_014061 [Fusarium duplospermum]|uniref:Uncharacterized protein n=1 Tax=Fusarium duplospermum TaxID=1325734 RepID=A0A428NYP8_9HYPO|nr:hypothetical protein CEP54_014061 [Fusarium duplospermum]